MGLKKGSLFCRWGRLVPVANRRAPRASRSALSQATERRAREVPVASRGGTQPRFLNSCVQPGSWFFPRSARSSEPQLGVGEADRYVPCASHRLSGPRVAA